MFILSYRSYHALTAGMIALSNDRFGSEPVSPNSVHF